jgi:hypothetical protein
MTTRITTAQLETLIARLNRITGSPETPWTRVDGRNVANIGNYHLSGAYGGVCVRRMVNTSGGATTPIVACHVPKRELFDLLHAYIRGIEFAKHEMTH